MVTVRRHSSALQSALKQKRVNGGSKLFLNVLKNYGFVIFYGSVLPGWDRWMLQAGRCTPSVNRVVRGIDGGWLVLFYK
jgi:hypothetical protein